MILLDFLKLLKSKHCCPNCDDQGRRPVSNSQLQRWADGGAILVNGEKMNARQEVGKVESLVFFPKKDRRITIR